MAATLTALTNPTVKLKDAYGRFARTLAAAAVIGEVTLVFAENAAWASAWRVIALALRGVTCFIGGALLSKGMTMDVLFLLLFTAIFGGWAAWVSGRGETKKPKDANSNAER
jgi:hypothetical protein